MSVPVRLAAFAAGLLVCFGVGLAIGDAVGPVGPVGGGPAPATGHMTGH